MRVKDIAILLDFFISLNRDQCLIAFGEEQGHKIFSMFQREGLLSVLSYFDGKQRKQLVNAINTKEKK